MDKNVIEYVKALEDPEGHLEVDEVVKAGCNPNSPLYERFKPWLDDVKCGIEKRRDVAREVIREFRIVVQVTSYETQTVVRAYVREPAQRTGYRSVESVSTDSKLAAQSMLDMARRARGHLTTARDLGQYWQCSVTELVEAVTQVDQLIAKLQEDPGALFPAPKKPKRKTAAAEMRGDPVVHG